MENRLKAELARMAKKQSRAELNGLRAWVRRRLCKLSWVPDGICEGMAPPSWEEVAKIADTALRLPAEVDPEFERADEGV